MSRICLVAALILAGVATVLGFRWFGTDGEHWEGWISASLFFLVLSFILPDELPRR